MDMNEISEAELAHLASLSKIRLKPEETLGLRQDLAKIVSYVSQLSEVDTDGVEPTYQVGNLQNVWREDEVEEPIATPDQLIKLAPASKGRQIEVPKVL